ncbi:MAG: hypothetical protein KDD56_04750 [Bdellovibrionales bacterium]|nr:hypothetical protein [Bdellovibrionales bacterium]
MDSLNLDDVISSDPTWKRAHELVNTYLPITTQTWQLVKASWYGEADLTRYVRTISFSYLDPKCLLVAAEMNNPAEFEPNVETLQQAIKFLGMKFSAVVLSVDVVCRMTLKTNPPSFWHKLFKDLITSVHIGYLFGAKCRELGLEAGAIMGFARYAGLVLLLASDHEKYRQLINSKNANKQLELFGCQDYQVTAIALQKLGYGTDVALGAALGIGKIAAKHNSYSREVLTWKNTVNWIEALEQGKPYPEIRTANRFFPELVPAGDNAKNLNLDALHADIKPLLANGSNWMWHVARGGYSA